MRGLQTVDGYTSALTLRETQKAIKLVKDTFANELAAALNLERVSAPFIVKKGSGINDDLNGVERKVEFDIKEIEGTAEIVQSLAKWKRTALKAYGYGVDEGLYTNMNAIRRDDDCDNVHSIFVDQWDWERVISKEERNVEFLKDIVKKIVGAIDNTQKIAHKAFPQLKKELATDVFFITTQELEVSSMGIRVDSESLAYQLKAADAEDRMKYDYHKGIADGTLPLTIGGGIGQSRLSMLILEKAHIGEVQVSLWPEKMIADCKNSGINLL